MPLPRKHQPEGTFTYADYLTWPSDERWEVIEGTPYNMTPAPGSGHQAVLTALLYQFYDYLKDRGCQVFASPFDVRLPGHDDAPKNIVTVVQPDISIICDAEKVDEAGGKGAPDLVVEILSPTTAGRDQIIKLSLYEQHGVREYWIVHPVDRIVWVYVLGPDGAYGKPAVYDHQATVNAVIMPGLTIELSEIFREKTWGAT